jgi:hypothetical protein
MAKTHETERAALLEQLQAVELLEMVPRLKSADALEIARQTNATRKERGFLAGGHAGQLFGAVASSAGLAEAQSRAGK